MSVERRQADQDAGGGAEPEVGGVEAGGAGLERNAARLDVAGKDADGAELGGGDGLEPQVGHGPAVERVHQRPVRRAMIAGSRPSARATPANRGSPRSGSNQVAVSDICRR